MLDLLKNRHLKKSWVEIFGRAKQCYQVTLAELCKFIISNNAADNEFKMNFMVLMSNVLIEGSSTPYVNKIFCMMSIRTTRSKEQETDIQRIKKEDYIWKVSVCVRLVYFSLVFL